MINPTPRVLVDLSHLHPHGLSGGIKPALLEMLRWLSLRKDPALHFVYVVKAGFEPEVAAFMRLEDRLLTAANLPRDLAAREHCDIVYCPFGSTALSCPGIPTLTLIVDLLHRDYPASLTLEEQAMRESWFREGMQRTDRFQVISDYTARQLTSHYGVAPDRMFRTYLPLHERFDRPGPAPRTARAPFFYYPANAWAHKNHANLLSAYAEYLRCEGSRAWRLVLTGAEDERMKKVRSLATELKITAHVDFLGYVSESRLAELWTQAEALVFPSLHEGFGMPLLEAMAHGVPILASQATAIPEITGPAALLVDAREPAELVTALTRMATDSLLRQTLIERGRRQLGLFSQDREFGKLQQALLETAHQPARWRRTGYYEADGLTDPEAVFALPLPLRTGTLRASLRALPADRTVQFWSGSDQVGEKNVPAFHHGEFTQSFSPKLAAVSIRVTNANRLSATDPRVHGILLGALSWEDATGVTDLLS